MALRLVKHDGWRAEGGRRGEEKRDGSLKTRTHQRSSGGNNASQSCQSTLPFHFIFYAFQPGAHFDDPCVVFASTFYPFGANFAHKSCFRNFKPQSTSRESEKSPTWRPLPSHARLSPLAWSGKCQRQLRLISCIFPLILTL